MGEKVRKLRCRVIKTKSTNIDGCWRAFSIVLLPKLETKLNFLNTFQIKFNKSFFENWKIKKQIYFEILKKKNLKSAPPANQRRSLAVKYNSGCDET